MTTILLLIVLILMVALPGLLKENRELVGMARIGLIVVAFLLVGIRWIAAPTEQLEGNELFDSTNWAVGWKLGQALAEDFADGGKVAVMVNDNPAESMVAMAEEQVAGLKEGVKKVDLEIEVFHPAGHAKAVFSDHPDPQAVQEFIAQAEGAVAIVSFVAFPFSRFKSEAICPVYVHDAYGSGYWKRWMKAGKVAAATYPHMNFHRMSNADAQRGSPEERFGAMFDLATPETLKND